MWGDRRSANVKQLGALAMEYTPVQAQGGEGCAQEGKKVWSRPTVSELDHTMTASHIHPSSGSDLGTYS